MGVVRGKDPRDKGDPYEFSPKGVNDMSKAMLDDDDTPKGLVADILNPTTRDIERNKLKEFLLGFIDKMEQNDQSIDDVKKIVDTCLKLWEEKEAWKQVYYDLSDRYTKHLDDEIERYNKMLGRKR